MNTPSINIDLSAIWSQFIYYIGVIIDFFARTSISFGGHTFTLLQIFAGSIAFSIFAELFIMAFLPGSDGSDFQSDSGEDYIDEDYDN